MAVSLDTQLAYLEKLEGNALYIKDPVKQQIARENIAALKRTVQDAMARQTQESNS